MAALSAGDTTTQFAIWQKANATAVDANTKLREAMGTALTLPATTDIMTLWKKFLAR